MSHCKPENKRKALLGRTSGKYCPECKMRIRGVNHFAGRHHLARIKRKDVA